jgi:hypothetical protein
MGKEQLISAWMISGIERPLRIVFAGLGSMEVV